MKRTILGWLRDAEEVLDHESTQEEDLREIALLAMTAIKDITEIHGHVAYCSLEYCKHCQDLWPCDTVRRIARALEVRA